MWELLAQAYMSHKDVQDEPDIFTLQDRNYIYGRYVGAKMMYRCATNYTEQYIIGTLKEYRRNANK